MSDDEYGPVPAFLGNGLLNQGIGGHIHTRRCFVHHNDPGIQEQSPSQAKKLPLSLAEVGTIFFHLGQ